MNLQFYLEKLVNSESHREFVIKNSEAYFSGGFFVIDVEGEGRGNEQNIDFYCPEKKEHFSFCLSQGCQIKTLDILDREVIPEKIPLSTDFNFEEITDLIFGKIKEQEIKNKVQKILFSMQNKEGKIYLVGSVFISGFGLIKFRVLPEKMEIVDFEKKSFFDLIRVVKKDEDFKE